MLGAHVGSTSHCGAITAARPVDFPLGFAWDQASHPFGITQSGNAFRSDLKPRDLVDPAIWTGPVFHVDSATGDDDNSGVGAFEGDFALAKRTIYSAFEEGNATGGAYRVLVKSGLYEESAFTRNGNSEPTQPLAILGYGGPVRYRTGPFTATWTDAGGSYAAPVSSVKRVFRTDVLTPEGQYSELQKVADVATCQATEGSWALDGSSVHVNIASAPSSTNIALIRSFHGARFMSHDKDIYLENIHCEGGISGALHFDAVATRNVIGVDCSFRYSAPSNANSPLDAARVRRTVGLVAFFNCDASFGAKDGWSFHEDGSAGMHVLMQNCTGHHNGIDPATSCNGLTIHDAINMIVLGGSYGMSRNGTEIHCIQSTQSWLAGTKAVARDIDGTSVAFKCSNQAFMWLQNTVADAAGSVENYAIEANAGNVFKRDHTAISGSETTSVGGVITTF